MDTTPSPSLSQIGTRPQRQWQLAMFDRSLKKRLKLDALLSFLGDVKGRTCLLVTCGDNNGALNWHFRVQGGQWTWADLSGANLTEIRDLLGEPVEQIAEAHFPYADGYFDCVVAIDVLEHLPGDQPFLQELLRVLQPGGRALVTVPNGDPRLLANRIKWRMGMTPAVYGHTRAGYTISELSWSLQQAGFRPIARGGYSRLFTELMELVINFSYVFVLRNKAKTAPGHIAPTTSREIKAHGAAYRLYSMAYPVMRCISRLDRFLPARTDNAVIVVAQRPGSPV